MTFWHGFLIAWLAASAVIVLGKSLVGSVREYGAADAIFGTIEIAFLIWIVAVKL